ncbi:MAG TPA: hypothetical protein VNH11_25820 [Pirellulales bacterium]|nr:hypothetical protein [Pirellulales bacterium]
MSWNELWHIWRHRPVPAVSSIDDELMFHFRSLVDENLSQGMSAAGQRAIQLAAVKDGYALTSMYELKKAGESFDSDALKLQLDDAVPLTLTVRDAQGRAAAKARVIPFSRQAAGGEQHGVYFQAAKPIELVADDAGRVRVVVFRRGDKAEIYLALPGKDWEQQAVAIPETGDVFEVSSKEVADGN